MCDECKAWFQSKTQSGGGAAEKKTTIPKYTKTAASTGDTKPGASKKGLIIGIGAAAVLLLAVLLAVVLLKGQDAGERDLKEKTRVSEETEKNAGQEKKKTKSDQKKQEPKPWEKADIQAIDGEPVILDGILTNNQLRLDEELSVYVLSDAGEPCFFERVQYVDVKDAENIGKIERYAEDEVTVKGQIYASENTVHLLLERIAGEPSLKEAEGNIASENTGIHEYDLIVKDCTWMEAFQESIDRGGHLVRFNSDAEYAMVLQKIQDMGMGQICFYIGGRRELRSEEYYWVDEENLLVGEPLNDSEFWMTGEPGRGVPGSPAAEVYMNLSFYPEESRFAWGDGPEDLPKEIPALKGRVGYIVEYENGNQAQ